MQSSPGDFNRCAVCTTYCRLGVAGDTGSLAAAGAGARFLETGHTVCAAVGKTNAHVVGIILGTPWRLPVLILQCAMGVAARMDGSQPLC